MFIRVLKALFRRPLLIVAFAIYSILLLFHFTQSVNNKSVTQSSVPQRQVVVKSTPGLPVRLLIPVINVNAAIQDVGVNTKGEMDVPSNTADVGWFKLGSRPGEKGSAVISGHFNGKDGEAAVFTNLQKLKQGDKLYIEDDSGTSFAFVVRESLIYNPGFAEEVFSLNDIAHLNLVTCDGVWDGAKKSYSKRLVVFADAS